MRLLLSGSTLPSCILESLQACRNAGPPGPTSHGRRAAAGVRRRPLTRMREVCAHGIQHNDALRLRKLHHLWRHRLRCTRALSHCHPRASAHQRAFKCSLQLLHNKPHTVNRPSGLRMHVQIAPPAAPPSALRPHPLASATQEPMHTSEPSTARSMSYACAPYSRVAMDMRTLSHWAINLHM